MSEQNPAPEAPQVELAAESAVAPAPETSFSLTAKDLTAILKEAVKEATAPFQATVNDLAAQNAKLQEEMAQMSALGHADGIPAHLRGVDPRVNGKRADIAMSVTLATRPVRDNPEQYEHVVSGDGLNKTTLTQLIKNIEDSGGPA